MSTIQTQDEWHDKNRQLGELYRQADTLPLNEAEPVWAQYRELKLQLDDYIRRKHTINGLFYKGMCWWWPFGADRI